MLNYFWGEAIRHSIYVLNTLPTKAFRLYDPETKTVCVSRDVVFEERKSWDWHLDAQITDAQVGTFTMTNSGTVEVSDRPTESEATTSRDIGDGYEDTDSSGGSISAS